MNEPLQGLGENVLTSGDKILEFKGKLNLWKIMLQKQTNKQTTTTTTKHKKPKQTKLPVKNLETFPFFLRH